MSLTRTCSDAYSDATYTKVSWSSSKSSVASVDQKGSVTALSVGSATITASAGGKSASCKVTVIAKTIAVSGITLDKTELSLNVGEEYQLKATISPSNASEKNLSWSSLSSSIATVKDGLVKGVSVGETEITASCGGKKNVCKVKITPIEVESITLNKTELDLFVGDSETITATIKPDNATNKSVSWSSSDTRIASVDNGSITGIKKGVVTIIAKAGALSAKCNVSIKEKEETVTSLYLNYESLTLPAGDFKLLKVAILPENANSGSLKWKSSNTSIVTVNDGLIQGISKGEAVVTVFNDKVSAQCKISVINQLSDLQTPLCLTAIKSTKIVISNPDVKRTIEYSFDRTTWETSNSMKLSIELNEKESVYLRGDGALFGVADLHDEYDFNWVPGKANLHISCDDCYVYGNVISLMYKDSYSTSTTMPEGCTCGNLFRNCTMKNHPHRKLVLPLTKLPTYCYAAMFRGCSFLQQAPELPATVLSEGCYSGMFMNCMSLWNAPQLPAESAPAYCYYQMFLGTSLNSAPDLPATDVSVGSYREMFSDCKCLFKAPIILPSKVASEDCYLRMFQNCTSLVQAPNLPATTLGVSCYEEMFENCSSLTLAPELPATIMKKGCYMQMFRNCTSLTVAPDLPAKKLSIACYREMFENCSSLIEAVQLPATDIPIQAYLSMFEGCTSLTKAPKISAERGINENGWDGYCDGMFKNCRNLRYIHFETHFSYSGFDEWVTGVAPTGTFVTKKGQKWPIGDKGVPGGWTIEYD